MIRNHLYSTFAALAGLLLSGAAAAQSSPGAAPNGSPAVAAQHAGDKPKGDDKGDKAAPDSKDAKAKGADVAADRASRVKAQHEAEAAQLRAVLHGPMTDALKQELRHHAQRVAKLERIRNVATEAKDTATVTRATKLLDKENARYEKWLASLSTKTETTGSNQAKAGAQ
jgi:hypothetical protein